MKHPDFKGMIVGHFSALETKRVPDEPSLTMVHCHSLVALHRRRGQSFPAFSQWNELWCKVCPNGLGRDAVALQIAGGRVDRKRP
jgi:hypothetical protein